ncbi:glycosyltransferase, partial [Schaalia hyovaginalis]
DYFSPDVANWLRGIGWVLSPSTEESFHLAPAEGMASGAVPVIWDRPGAAGTFGQEWIVEDSADRIAEFIGGVARDEQRFHDLQERAVAAIARYDRGKIIATWFSLIFARV